MNKKINIIVCDDFRDICEYVAVMCAETDDVECVATCNSSAECLQAVEKYKPDVLLLDIQMEEEDSGIQIITRIKEISPDTKIIILTVHIDDDYVVDAFFRGADNYILKTETFDNMLTNIRDVYYGSNKIQPNIARILATNNRKSIHSIQYIYTLLCRLTKSEFKILNDIYSGLGVAEIMEKNFLSERTVRNHLYRICKKFKVHSKEELVELLKEFKLLDYINVDE